MSAFLVFECPACREKIFAERSQVGKRGNCPLCGAPTVVGGGAAAPDARSGPERRRARRVPIANARLTCETRTGEGRSVNADDVPLIDDISESGVGFKIKGDTDRKRMGGYGPPAWLKLGDTVTITLHIPQLFRPRSVKAVVKRIVPVPHRKELFRVGAEFAQADEQILRDLRKVLEAK